MAFNKTQWNDDNLPDITAAQLNRLEQGIADAHSGLNPPPLVAALPANPVDGQVIDYLANATSGSVWRLRYRAASASAYKWEYVGGSRIGQGPLGSITTTSAPFVDLTGGPSVTIPLAGDYETLIGLFCQSNGAPANNLVANLAVGSIDTGIGVTLVASGQFDGATIERTLRNTFALGNVLTLVVRTPNGISSTFQNAWIYAQPIRVG